MNLNKVAGQAERAAQSAIEKGPAILHHKGKVYTFVFCPNEWVFKVYEDGFYFASFNTKKITQAKRWTKEHAGE